VEFPVVSALVGLSVCSSFSWKVSVANSMLFAKEWRQIDLDTDILNLSDG
jgi:hypothetical protein